MKYFFFEVYDVSLDLEERSSQCGRIMESNPH